MGPNGIGLHGAGPCGADDIWRAPPSAPSTLLRFLRLHAAAEPGSLDSSDEGTVAMAAFRSLVEHLERWGRSIDGSGGLCMAEAAVPAAVFSLAAATAGLLPTDAGRAVRTSPENHTQACCGLTQLLTQRPFRIRLAEPQDLPRLLELDVTASRPAMRVSRRTLQMRLKASAMETFVCTVAGEIVGVLYGQRISLGEAQMPQQTWRRVGNFHKADGHVLQIVSVVVDPKAESLGVCRGLRDCALLLARLTPSIDSVVAVAELRLPAEEASGTIDRHRWNDLHDEEEMFLAVGVKVGRHLLGEEPDPLLDFHTGHGGWVEGLIRDFYPEDETTSDIGALVRYNLADLHGHCRRQLELQRELIAEELHGEEVAAEPHGEQRPEKPAPARASAGPAAARPAARPAATPAADRRGPVLDRRGPVPDRRRPDETAQTAALPIAVIAQALAQLGVTELDLSKPLSEYGLEHEQARNSRGTAANPDDIPYHAT